MTTDDTEGPRERYPREQVLRETMLYLATPEDLAALFRLGDMMNLYLVEYHTDGLTMRDGLVAVAKDLRHLAGYLTETAEMVPHEGAEGRSGRTLTTVATNFARKLGRIAGWLEWELGVAAAEEARTASDPARGGCGAPSRVG